MSVLAAPGMRATLPNDVVVEAAAAARPGIDKTPTTPQHLLSAAHDNGGESPVVTPRASGLAPPGPGGRGKGQVKSKELHSRSVAETTRANVLGRVWPGPALRMPSNLVCSFARKRAGDVVEKRHGPATGDGKVAKTLGLTEARAALAAGGAEKPSPCGDCPHHTSCAIMLLGDEVWDGSHVGRWVWGVRI